MPEPDDFSSALETLFRELHTRWLELAPEQIVITDERLRQELALPIGTRNRICYFALPALLVSSYRDSVFPLAEHAGLVSATGDETLGKGGTLRAMIDMLLGRAEVVIADVSTGDSRVRRELRAARQRLPPNRIAIISDGQISEESSGPMAQVFVRPVMGITAGTQGAAAAIPDQSSWLWPLRAWLDATGKQVTSSLAGEARRLLSQNVYPPAVITAASALEVTLQDALDAPSGSAATASPTGPRLTVLLERALERDILKPDEAANARELQNARSALVHTHEAMDAARARELVERALAIVDRLTKTA